MKGRMYMNQNELYRIQIFTDILEKKSKNKKNNGLITSAK